MTRSHATRAMPSGSSSCPTAVRSISDQPPRPRAADCSRSGSTLWELPLEPGWWRTNTSSRDIRSCRDDQSDAPGCAGGKNESVCKPGLTGPYCRVRCATAWLAHVHYSALGYAKVDARTCRLVLTSWRCGPRWQVCAPDALERRYYDEATFSCEVQEQRGVGDSAQWVRWAIERADSQCLLLCPGIAGMRGRGAFAVRVDLYGGAFAPRDEARDHQAAAR